MRRTILVALVTSAVLTAWPAWLPGQPVFTGAEIFPAEEFAARRARVMDRVGGAVAVVQGTTERPGEQPLRQNNQFFYLTGVVEPRAIVLLDGRAKRTTLFLLPLNERREGRMFGPGLHPGEEAVKATGIDAVLARDEFAKALDHAARDGRTIYTTFRPEVLGEASSSDPAAPARATRDDPWDGRGTREETFIAKLKAAAPLSDIKDLGRDGSPRRRRAGADARARYGVHHRARAADSRRAHRCAPGGHDSHDRGRVTRTCQRLSRSTSTTSSGSCASRDCNNAEDAR